MSSNKSSHNYSLLLFVLQIALHSTEAGTQFSSHVTVNTPARSYSHGVGDPIPSASRRSFDHNHFNLGLDILRKPYVLRSYGYQKSMPSFPFINEDLAASKPVNVIPWQLNSFADSQIPVLPPSPYKVDSPDPESLWPEGLFLPPMPPTHFGPKYGRRLGTNPGEVLSDPLDPYLLEGAEATDAVEQARKHGLLYFHDIPHIQSLLENQEKRIRNNLEKHRIGSIRKTWPYNRP